MAKRKRRSKKPGRRGKSGDGKKADHQERPGPPGKKAGEKKANGKVEKKPKSAARNLVETIVVVAVLVLGIRFFLLEAFKIPSSSMEPALIGHPYHGDRVLAWKPSVRWMSPERWSVNVFVKHPDEHERLRGDDGDKNYIKRLIGLPRERVLIAGGDIFIEARGAAEAEIARKPRSMQERVWHAVYEGRQLKDSWVLDEALHFTEAGDVGSVAAIRGEAAGAAWATFSRNRHEGDGGLVTNLYVKRLRVRLRCPCGHEFKANIRTSRTRTLCPVCGREIDFLEKDASGSACRPERVWLRASCSNCGWAFPIDPPDIRTPVDCPECGKRIDPACCPGQPSDEVPVGDLRVGFDVTPDVASDERGFVLAEVSRDDERYLARVPLGGGEARVRGPHGVDAKRRVSAFVPGEARRILFAHVDQAVVLAIDGEEVIRQEYDLSWTERAGTPETNAVRIGIEGASVLFENPRIERDLHYLSRGRASIVEFYSGGRGQDPWRDSPAADVPVMAVRTRERLAEDEYFFMGDNSPSSHDSRMWGAVVAKDMVGRAFFAFWPPHQMGWMH